MIPIEELRDLMEKQITPEVFDNMVSANKDAAMERFIRGTWRGIARLDENSAGIIGRETCRCYEIWMPPDSRELISAIYDVNSPDVDRALTIYTLFEKVGAAHSGAAEAYVHRKGNIATLVTGQQGCQCPFVSIYKVIDPTPNLCQCTPNLFVTVFRELFNLPVKARVLETCNRGGDCCRFELEFPHELTKTPGYKY